jgi:hypothetical protein
MSLGERRGRLSLLIRTVATEGKAILKLRNYGRELGIYVSTACILVIGHETSGRNLDNDKGKNNGWDNAPRAHKAASYRAKWQGRWNVGKTRWVNAGTARKRCCVSEGTIRWVIGLRVVTLVTLARFVRTMGYAVIELHMTGDA